jgi:hypothetical protein
MEFPGAVGNRYICAGPHIWMRDIAKILAIRGLRTTTARPGELVVVEPGTYGSPTPARSPRWYGCG